MLLVTRGAANDPDEQPGLAALTADMLDEGSGGRSAIEMHEAMCTHNHTDGCGWFYEVSNGVHDWGGEHARWLGKAAKIQAFCQTNSMATEKAIELFKFMKVM